MSATSSAPKTQSVARRLTLLAVALLAVLSLLVSALVAESHIHDRLMSITGDKVQTIANSVDAMDNTARRLAERAYLPFRAQFPAAL